MSIKLPQLIADFVQAKNGMTLALKNIKSP